MAKRTTKPAKRATKARTTKPAAKRGAPKAPIHVPHGWQLVQRGKALQVEVKTKDFLEALVVMNEIGNEAEDLEHHPDFHLEKWNHLRIVTYSHDVGHLTERDERLAQRISELLGKRNLL